MLMALLCVSQVCLAQGPDRSNPPKAGPPAQLRLAPIQHLKLSNGVPVLLLEKHDVPLVQVEVVIRGGSVMDPREKAGRASMTADMLTEGAGARNALELADAIDYLGAQLSASASMHTTTVNLFTPLSKLDSALALMADVVMRPTFPNDELERNRKERLTSLLQWRDEARALASVESDRTLFGDDHPYGVNPMGSEKTLRGLSVEDLKEFHRQYYQANNTTVIAVGDVKAVSVLPKLEKVFGAWKTGQIPSVVIAEPKQVTERSVVLVDKPGAAQSEIRIGRIGAPRLTDDYYAIVVMNTILGGSFTSRLNNNLREQHGYTYGAGSYFDFRNLPGPFLAYSAVQTAVTDKALIEFMKELNAILEPVPETEVDRAKNYVALSFPGDFQTVGQIAHQLVQLVAYNLPDDYFNNFVGRILAVTKKDVERVAKKYIDPTTIAIIVCGDRAQIETGVRAMNLGPMKVLTVEDVLGKAPVVGEK